MYKTGQKLTRKEGQDKAGLPEEVRIEEVMTIDSETKITISSEKGTFESTAEILESFYDLTEEMNEENLPRIVLEKLEDITAMFDIYGSTGSPEAGMKVKSELMKLSQDIRTITGETVDQNIALMLGKKVS